MSAWKCQCASPNCNLTVELSEEIIQQVRNYRWNDFHRHEWIVIVNGCAGNVPDGYKLLQRKTGYNIYSSDIKADIESAVETADIINDPEVMDAFRQGIKAIEAGRFITLEQLKRELDLE